VEPHAVVKDFDPFKDGGARAVARGELATMDGLQPRQAYLVFVKGSVKGSDLTIDTKGKPE
jgi:hypothetical protein